MGSKLTVLEYLERELAGTLHEGDTTHMRYPTAISRLLQFRIVGIGAGYATLALQADAAIHGNQQGTVHGGLLCELADAAIGTAHSTLLSEGESFTSIDLKSTFYRPVWKSSLRAHATALHRGRTTSHYECTIRNDDDKVVATVTSIMMTLRGSRAEGR